MKLGIIRCMQTRDICPGTSDFKAIRDKKGAFEGVEGDIEIIGFIDCGGCPGKTAFSRTKELVKRGADTIAIASCISLGTPIGFPCPNAKEMEQVIRKAAGPDVKILDHTHNAPPKDANH